MPGSAVPQPSAPCRGARASASAIRRRPDARRERAAPHRPMNSGSAADAAAQDALAVSTRVDVERWKGGTLAHTTDLVAEEVPVALVYHEVPHVVMLATPADLEDYAVGFTLSEGLVARREEIRGVEVTRGEGVADVHITVAWERFSELIKRRRNLTGRTGCGLCGAETAGDAIREVAPVPPGVSITAAEMHAVMEELSG